MSTSDISTFFLSWMIVADVVHGALFLIGIKYILDAFHYISNDPSMQRRVGPPGINGGGPIVTHKIPKAQLFMQKLRWITVLLIFLRIIFITICGFKNGDLYYETEHSASTSEQIFAICYWILEETTAEGRFIIIIVIFLRMTEILMQLYNIEFNGRLLPRLKEKQRQKSRLTKFFFGTKKKSGDDGKFDNLIDMDTKNRYDSMYSDVESKLRVLNTIKTTSIVAIFLDGIRRIIDGVLWLTRNANLHKLWQILLSTVIHTLFYIAFITFVVCTFVVYYKANQHYKKMKTLSDAEKQIKQVKSKSNSNSSSSSDSDSETSNSHSNSNEEHDVGASSMNSKITQQTNNTLNNNDSNNNNSNTLNGVNRANIGMGLNMSNNFSINSGTGTNRNNNNNNNTNNSMININNKVMTRQDFIASQLPEPINIQLLAKEDKKRQIGETIVRLRRISPLFLIWCLFYVYYESVDFYKRWFAPVNYHDYLKLLFDINLYWIYWGVCDTILYVAIIYYLKPIETTHMRIQEQIRLHTLKVHKAIMNARQMEIDAQRRMNKKQEMMNKQENYNQHINGGGKGYHPPNIGNDRNNVENVNGVSNHELTGVVTNVTYKDEEETRLTVTGQTQTQTQTLLTDEESGDEYSASSNEYTRTATQSGY